MENNHIYELFIKYQKGKLSSSEYQELKIWLNASSDNQAAFIVFLRVKKIEAQQQMLLQINPSEIWEQQLQKKIVSNHDVDGSIGQPLQLFPDAVG